VAPRPSPLYHLIAAVSWPVVHLVYRLDAHGVEHLPAEGGYVLASNHLSNFDPWPLGLPLWPRRFLRFMAKSELYWWPLSLLLGGAGAFPVHRGQADVEALETAVGLAGAGQVVAMFPEGTRRRKGLRKKFEARPRTGAARIALDAGVPVVPAAVKGTDGLARLAQLRVAYGPPIPPEGTPQELTERMMGEIERLYATL
jgi:1-acyl-sn-glycerol-3-phosphate acyltransferase